MLLSRPARRATGGAQRSQSEDGGEGGAGSGGGGDGGEWAMCAAPKKKKKQINSGGKRVRGGWGRGQTGTAREGWVEVEVEREGDTRERGDPVPEAPPESRERQKSPPHQHPHVTHSVEKHPSEFTPDLRQHCVVCPTLK